MKNSSLLKIIILIFFIISCNKDDLFSPNNDSINFIQNFDEYKGENISIETLLIRVTDEYKVPIKDATILVGGISKLTDERGIVVLSNIGAYEKFLTAQISKLSYISTSKTISPSSEGQLVLEVELLKPDIIETVNSGSEIIVGTPSGAQVKFTGNFIKADGSEYTGALDISIKHLSPNNTNIFEVLPGSLLGQDSDENMKILETFGMLAVNLTGVSGEKLNIDSDNKATITMPIPADLLINAVDNIPLWFFNEEKGIWMEEGEAVKDGTNYIGEVSHFSWWNCDLPLDLVNICLSIENSDGNLLPNQQIKIIRNISGQIIYSGMTDSDGKLCGPIPKNEQITIKVFNEDLSCLIDGTVFEGNFGGYTNDNNDIMIVVQNNDIINYTISGNLINCDGSQISNGNLELTHQGSIFIIFPESDGSFNYEVIGCEGDIMSLRAYDNENQTTTAIQTLNFIDDSINVGILQPCTNYSERVYNGDLIVTTQDELDDFIAFGYTRINGKLHIGGSNMVTNLIGLEGITTIDGNLIVYGGGALTSLEGLEGLTSIGGGLYITGSGLSDLRGLNALRSIGSALSIRHNNTTLNTLDGLEQLVSIGGHVNISQNGSLTNLMGLNGLVTVGSYMSIIYNSALTDINGFENLYSIGSFFYIEFNDILTSINGFNKLSIVNGQIYIDTNDELKYINGFEKLSVVVSMNIQYNPELESLSNFDELTSIEYLFIQDNLSLIDISGFSELVSIDSKLFITNNNSLQNLIGLDGLTYAENINIGYNTLLTNFCSLSNVTYDGDYAVSGNAYNPSYDQLSNPLECSQ